MKQNFINGVLGPQIRNIFKQIHQQILDSNEGDNKFKVEEKTEIAVDFLEELIQILNPEASKIIFELYNANRNGIEFHKSKYYKNAMWPRKWKNSTGKNGLGSWWLAPDIDNNEFSNVLTIYLKHQFLRNETLDWIFIHVETFLTTQEIFSNFARSLNVIKNEPSIAEGLSGGKLWKYSLIKFGGKILAFTLRWSVITSIFYLFSNNSSKLIFASFLAILLLYTCNRIRIYIIRKINESRLTKEFEQDVKNISAIESTLNSQIISTNTLEDQIFQIRGKHPNLHVIYEAIFKYENKKYKEIIFKSDLANISS